MQELPTLTRREYREWRARMVSGENGIRAYRVDGDLIRHCDFHRQLQRGLVQLRACPIVEG